MGFLKTLGGAIGNVAQSIGSFLGFDTSGFENDEAQNWQANQADIGRQWQELMLQKQFDYSTDMWNKTNAYNSPKNQANLWREGGMNPYQMLNGQSSVAQVGGTPTGMSAPSPGSGHSSLSQPTTISEMMDNLASVEHKKQDLEYRKEELEGLKIENRHKNAMLLETLTGLRKDNEAKGINNKWLDETLDATLKGIIRTNALTETQERLVSMQAVYQDLVNTNYPEQFKAQVAELASRVALNKAAENFTFEQAQSEYYRGLSELEKKSGIKLDNDLKRSTFDAAVESAYRNAHSASNLTDFLSKGIFGSTSYIKYKLKNR